MVVLFKLQVEHNTAIVTPNLLLVADDRPPGKKETNEMINSLPPEP